MGGKTLIQPAMRKFKPQSASGQGRIVTLADLCDLYKALLEDASRAKERAYAPYSGFMVGASVLVTASENTTYGMHCASNIENVSFRLTLCAEEAALAVAHASGSGDNVIGIAVTARNNGANTTEVTNPCGACLQVIRQYAMRSGIDIELLLATTDFGKIVLTSISALLPGQFGAEVLRK